MENLLAQIIAHYDENKPVKLIIRVDDEVGFNIFNDTDPENPVHIAWGFSPGDCLDQYFDHHA
jgi:hypothetical protein